MTDMRARQKGLALALPAALFGFLVATQWSTVADPASRDVQIRYVAPLTGTVARLQDEQTALKTELADVRQQLDALQAAASTQSGSMRDLRARIDELKAVAGLTEVAGEGVVVTLDAARPPSAEGSDRPACLASDLADVVNALWRGGAIAIAIGDERVVGSSSVYCVGATIVVNGAIVSPPFSLAAVGRPSGIVATLDDPAQLADLKRRRDQRAVTLAVEVRPVVSVPAYSGPLAARRAVPR